MTMTYGCFTRFSTILPPFSLPLVRPHPQKSRSYRTQVNTDIKGHLPARTYLTCENIAGNVNELASKNNPSETESRIDLNRKLCFFVLINAYQIPLIDDNEMIT